MEADKVMSLSKQLEDSCTEKNIAVAEISLLKQQLEEMEMAFRHEITELKETHLLEIENISNEVILKI